MTDTIKQKALALVNEVRTDRGWSPNLTLSERDCSRTEALCRAIEQHEAYKQEVSDAMKLLSEEHEAYKQEVSAMLIDEYGEEFCRDHSRFARFIIAKPDPLVDAWMDAFPGNHIDDAREECAKINAALAARGLEIREKQP